jgi:hypothetical protein
MKVPSAPSTDSDYRYILAAGEITVYAMLKLCPEARAASAKMLATEYPEMLMFALREARREARRDKGPTLVEMPAKAGRTRSRR